MYILLFMTYLNVTGLFWDINESHRLNDDKVTRKITSCGETNWQNIFQYFCIFCVHNPLNNLLIRQQVIRMTLSTLWGWLEKILIVDNYKFCQDYWKIMGCYLCNIFPKSPHIYVQIWKGSTRLILVNFLFLKSTQNFLQDGGNFVFVAICGGSSHILTGLLVKQENNHYHHWNAPRSVITMANQPM